MIVFNKNNDLLPSDSFQHSFDCDYTETIMVNTPIHSPVSNSKRSIWWYASWGRPAKPLSGQRLAPNVVGGTVLVQLFSSHQA